MICANGADRRRSFFLLGWNETNLTLQPFVGWGQPLVAVKPYSLEDS
jgi:hypothetical protein